MTNALRLVSSGGRPFDLASMLPHAKVVTGNTLLVGRCSERCDIRVPVVDDTSEGEHTAAVMNVSRVHCKLVRADNGAWWVHDNNSLNGVFVN
eukprot:COSAG05_NODE_2786_length_2637_cov_6.436769_1_plen_92_part_10